MELKTATAALEAILFAAGKPVPLEKIAIVFDVDIDSAGALMEKIRIFYNGDESRGLKIAALGDSFQLCTREEYFERITLALQEVKFSNLSSAALEVLAVIAYNQPVTRAYIEQIRGVDCVAVLSTLTERGLICESGRLDAPGRPNLYSVTPDFLRVFGLSNLHELPTLPSKAAEGETKEQSWDQIPIPGV